MTTLWDILFSSEYLWKEIEVPCPICAGGDVAILEGQTCPYCIDGKIRYDLDECEVVEDD